MRTFLALSLGLLAFASTATLAKECNRECRQKCIDKDLGDECVEDCGCETLTNGAAEAFGDQQVCLRSCKNDCNQLEDSGQATICSLTCLGQCNQLCTHMCDYFGFGEECHKDCSIELPKSHSLVDTTEIQAPKDQLSEPQWEVREREVQPDQGLKKEKVVKHEETPAAAEQDGKEMTERNVEMERIAKSFGKEHGHEEESREEDREEETSDDESSESDTSESETSESDEAEHERDESASDKIKRSYEERSLDPLVPEQTTLFSQEEQVQASPDYTLTYIFLFSVIFAAAAIFTFKKQTPNADDYKKLVCKGNPLTKSFSEDHIKSRDGFERLA